MSSSGRRVRTSFSFSVRMTSSAPSEPTQPSKLPPFGTVSRWEPNQRVGRGGAGGGGGGAPPRIGPSPALGRAGPGRPPPPRPAPPPSVCRIRAEKAPLVFRSGCPELVEWARPSSLSFLDAARLTRSSRSLSGRRRGQPPPAAAGEGGGGGQ